MSTNYKLRISQNPNFNTVQGLTNRTWDPENVPVVSGRGATEDQLQVVDERIVNLSQNVPTCTDDPFTHLEGRVSQMEEAFANCSDDPWVIVNQRLTELQNRQTTCCNIPQDDFIALARAKINEIIAAVNTCCDSVTPVTPIP